MILKLEVKSNNSFKINELYKLSATCVHRVGAGRGLATPSTTFTQHLAIYSNYPVEYSRRLS